MSEKIEMVETDMPWVSYTYGLTHDNWWPFWNSTRILGVARIGCACRICGERKIVRLRIKRVGAINNPAGYRHPERWLFLSAHAHVSLTSSVLDCVKAIRALQPSKDTEK